MRIVEILATLIVYVASVVEGGCEPPKPIVGGYFQPYQEDYQYGEKIHYYCEDGYEQADSSVSTKTCQGFPSINAFIWTGGRVGCTLVDCGAPSIPDAQYDSPTQTTYGSTMHYKCNDGLAPMGTLLAQCNANATWQYTSCQEPEFYCSKPPEVAYTKLNASRTRHQHGTTIQYQCKKGYTQQGGSGSLYCKKTTWIGELPTCVKTTPVVVKDGQVTVGQKDAPARVGGLSENALPIVAGVVTAVLLTAILIVTVLCLRKRYKRSSDSENNSESGVTSPPDAASTPHQHNQLVSSGSIKMTAGHQLTPITPVEGTLPYHRIQCHHHHMVGDNDYAKSDQNYVPDSSLSHFKPLVAGSDHTHSSSPSTVQSEVSVTDSELHTMREYLGDFGNNNIPSSHPPPHNLLPPHVHSYHHQHPQQHRFHTLHPSHHNVSAFQPSSTTPRTRTLWTPDGRPYEAVTCSHGVEHIYQPLEHIYEEPHTWTRPLPNPHQYK